MGVMEPSLNNSYKFLNGFLIENTEVDQSNESNEKHSQQEVPDMDFNLIRTVLEEYKISSSSLPEKIQNAFPFSPPILQNPLKEKKFTTLNPLSFYYSSSQTTTSPPTLKPTKNEDLPSLNTNTPPFSYSNPFHTEIYVSNFKQESGIKRKRAKVTLSQEKSERIAIRKQKNKEHAQAFRNKQKERKNYLEKQNEFILTWVSSLKQQIKGFIDSSDSSLEVNNIISSTTFKSPLSETNLQKNLMDIQQVFISLIKEKVKARFYVKLNEELFSEKILNYSTQESNMTAQQLQPENTNFNSQ
jgi:hypothetical protein